MRCVLDASMALSFVIADEFTARSKRTLASVVSDGAIVPTLWTFEVLNAVLSAQLRGRLSPAAATNAIHGLEALPIERDGRAIDGVRLTALSREFELTAYDGAYLALALDANLPLATLDARLTKAATAAGVALMR
jgi:predicted nucleic acid-binding protein